MSVLSGFKRFKDYILTESGYQICSRWTSANSVIMGDGTDDTDTVEKRITNLTNMLPLRLTQEQYDALSDTEKNNGRLYIIVES